MNTDAIYNPSNGTVALILDSATAMAALDYLDSIDLTDIALNPGYHGYSDDQANAISAALGSIRSALSKAATKL